MELSSGLNVQKEVSLYLTLSNDGSCLPYAACPPPLQSFVWGVLQVPKLWQGRERRTPKHAPVEQLYAFTPAEVRARQPW